jgi:hypothetical protein
MSNGMEIWRGKGGWWKGRLKYGCGRRVPRLACAPFTATLDLMAIASTREAVAALGEFLKGKFTPRRCSIHDCEHSKVMLKHLH